MTITITDPAVEAMIQLRLETGAFENAEDVVSKALELSYPALSSAKPRTQSRKEVFEAAKGLGEDADFARRTYTSRPVDFS